MKLDQLRRMALFAMVARKGSFTAVSKQQNIATSAISSAITQLEDEISTRLFHRTTRHLRLTVAGEVFLQHCEAMLHAAQTAHEALDQLTGQLMGSLTITVSEWEAQTWVLPALKPLLRANPKLSLNLLVQDERIDLIEHGVDIAIRTGHLEDSSLIARAITELPEVVVASPQYLSEQGEPLTTADLTERHIIAFTPFKQPQHLNLITPEGEAHNTQLKLGAKTDNVQITKELCLMGLGIARLPLAVVKKELAAGTLKTILPTHKLPTIKIYALTTKKTLQPAKVTAALAAFQTYMKTSPDWLKA